MPELFSGPALAQLYDKRRRDELEAVPYFDGLMAGEPDALVESFAARRNVTVENVAHVVTKPHGFEEVVLHLDGETGRVELPVAIVADREHDGHIDELRIYFSTWALTRRHANRPPLLQLDPELRAPDIVSEHQEALAAGDVDGIVAAFETQGYAREPAGRQYLHTGPDGLRSFYQLLFSNDGGIPPGTLRADRRQAHVRARVQRRPVGPDRGAARGRCRCLRTGSERKTHGGAHLR